MFRIALRCGVCGFMTCFQYQCFLFAVQVHVHRRHLQLQSCGVRCSVSMQFSTSRSATACFDQLESVVYARQRDLRCPALIMYYHNGFMTNTKLRLAVHD